MPFLTRVAVRREGTCRWVLLEDLVYEGTSQVFTVPAGFVTDFASVPQAFQSLVPRTGPWDEGAVLHDLFCVDLRRYADELRGGHLHPVPPLVSARDADGILRRIIRESGGGLARRWLIWTAIRWGALASYWRRPGWTRDAARVLAATAPVAALAAALVAALVVGGLDLAGLR